MELQMLTSAEENIMKILWPLQSFYLKEVMTAYPEPKPHQNTVSTYLKILVEKHYLRIEKEGRIFKYHICIERKNYQKFLLKNIHHAYFQNSGTLLLKFLIEEKLINQEDLDQWIKIKTEVFPISTETNFNKDQTQISELINELLELEPKKDKKNKKKKSKKKKKL